MGLEPETSQSLDHSTKSAHTIIENGFFTEAEALANVIADGEKRYPHLYHRKTLFPELTLKKHSVLVETKNIAKNKTGAVDVNTAWTGDGNPNEKEVHQSLTDSGYRLGIYPPIALFENSRKFEYRVINGRTRKKFFDNANYKNIIADVYEATPGYSSDKVESAITRFEQASNLQGYDAHGTTRQSDIYYSATRAVERGWISSSLNSDGISEPNEDEVREWIGDICGNYKFQKRTIDKLVYQIINSSEDCKTGKRYWDNRERVYDWLRTGDNKYFDTKDLHYEVMEVSDARRSVETISKIAWQIPKKKVRIILYKKFCDTINPEENFISARDQFVERFEGSLMILGSVFFNNAKVDMDSSNVEIYGMVPSLMSMGSLDRLWLYRPNRGGGSFWYQKTD